MTRNPDHHAKSPDRSSARARLFGHLAGLVAAVAVIFALAPGCDEVKHYETLSFFFDGVPLPPTDEELAAGPDGVATVSGEGDATEELVHRYHAPYANRNCFGCHDRSRGYSTPQNITELCRDCHQSHFQLVENDWQHGPVAVGECRDCHEPHRSYHDGLLVRDQRSVCFDCHSEEYVTTDPFHSTLEDPICSDCHDPHAAGNRKLLVDSRSYRRRTPRGGAPETGHDFWKQDTCHLCHDLKQANRLLGNTNQVCLTCHEDIAEAMDQPGLHEAVTQQQCLACHAPHKSPRPKLIRPTAEAICQPCHEMQDWRTADHPNVTRVDCFICHNGHLADREHLLKPGVGLVASTEGAGPMRSPEPADDAEEVEQP